MITEETLYAAVGRKQIALEEAHGRINYLMAVLQKVQDGEIEPDKITVDMENRTVHVE